MLGVIASVRPCHELNVRGRESPFERQFDRRTQSLRPAEVPKMIGKPRLVRGRDECVERQPDNVAAFPTEDGSAGEIDFANDPARAERHVTDRREIVEVDEAVARLLECPLRFDQLRILSGQFLMVNL